MISYVCVVVDVDVFGMTGSPGDGVDGCSATVRAVAVLAAIA